MAPWGFTPQNQSTAPSLSFGKGKQHCGKRSAVRHSLQGVLQASCSGGGLCMPCIPLWCWKADMGEYSQQSEKACLVNAFQEGLCKCRQYLRSKNTIQSSFPRYSVNRESDWRTVMVIRVKSFTPSHHHICINSPADEAATDCLVHSWQENLIQLTRFFCVLPRLLSYITLLLKDTALCEKGTDSISWTLRSLPWRKWLNLPLNLYKSNSDQSWEKVRICTLYPLFRVLTHSANKHLEKPLM